jgi:stage V sporulation protein AF
MVKKYAGHEDDEHVIPGQIDEFLLQLEGNLGYQTSFDVVVREMLLGERRTALVFMNGLVKEDVLTNILMRLTMLPQKEMHYDALYSFFALYVPGVQVTEVTDFQELLINCMAGVSAFYIDGSQTALMIDAKNFPGRSIEEPSLERVVRGSRDGFMETMLINVTLVRRRLRDKQLRLVNMRVGDRTQTDVCVAYIDDIVDKQLLAAIEDKIARVHLDGIPLADKQLEETIVARPWDPFPSVRYSERPDVVAEHLLEGNVAVFVDTSPSVMILPTTFFDHVQHAEENRQTPFIGTYLRWIRYLGIAASIFLLPLWFLMVTHPELKPAALSFIAVDVSDAALPFIVQILLAEIGVDLMRLASVHTPAPLSTAMSLFAALLLGDIAVKTGVFVNEVILYIAVATVGMFATPSYELSLANRIVRLGLLLASWLFGVSGFMLLATFIFVMMVTKRSFNRPFMWPFIPFDARGMLSILVRLPVLENRKRPRLLKPQQADKMPPEAAE